RCLPVSRSRHAGEPHAVRPADLRGLLRSELDGIPLGEIRAGQNITGARRVLLGDGVAQLTEEVLEAGRRDDLQDAARRVAGIPERVPLLARLVDEIPRLRVDDVVAEQRAHSPL